MAAVFREVETTLIFSPNSKKPSSKSWAFYLNIVAPWSGLESGTCGL